MSKIFLIGVCVGVTYLLGLMNPVIVAAEEGSLIDNEESLVFQGQHAQHLDQALAILTETLVKQGKLKNLPVLITRHDLYDAKTGLNLPLSTEMRGILISEMKKQGVRVLLEGADGERFMLLQGTWQEQDKELAIHVKIMKLESHGPEVVASGSVRVPLKSIDRKNLTPDRASWARYLVRQLEKKASGFDRRSLHIRNFNVKSNRCSPELGPYLDGWIRPALAESRMFTPIDQQGALRSVDVPTLRTRGTRTIRPNLPKDREEGSLTADLLQADAEMKCFVWLHHKKVEVQAKITGRNGLQITAASAEIPLGLFPQELLIPPEAKEPQPNAQGCCIAKDGLIVELATSRGEGRPFYHKDERIRFLVRLNRPAWVYLFNFNPDGEATLLYPVDDTGRLARLSRCGSLPKAGTPLILPEDGCSVNLVVDKPYGTDRVLALASESPLEIPEYLYGEWKQANFVLKALREQGLSGNGGYAEAEVEVVTGP